MRIGVHFGAVILSRLGADTHQHITATGDVVNVASRLLEAAKQSGAEMVFSDSVVAAGSITPDVLRSFAGPQEITIRGRAEPLAIWLGTSDRAEHVEGIKGANVGRRRANTP